MIKLHKVVKAFWNEGYKPKHIGKDMEFIAKWSTSTYNAVISVNRKGFSGETHFFDRCTGDYGEWEISGCEFDRGLVAACLLAMDYLNEEAEHG